MQQKTVFLEHSCEGLVAWRDALRHAQAEKDKASFEQRKDEWAEERRLRKEAAQADNTQQWEYATTVECPKCEVGVGVRCHNLTERRRGIEKETGWPHPERTLIGLKSIINPSPHILSLIEIQERLL